ncbi:DNA polymerase III subunit gamma and tau [Microbacterium sp. SLBN-146]|uniref:DNA polymerase III subunit gamma and tau n=1 Tax=Microbacterium sp. SLBN-146 TaxID=2768457 RepID=UPI00114F8A46|nr:DNA polymerase III subunit gamma and tau [Microbacterium sp. SLBN-146]TQJ31347.1 DNA polymerase-3 subunit gamma/tau [Microbacterium sp. SLBN-146]
MTAALYRRYRPESFGEMIGQGQVTEPLMTALRGDRVGHAYLFSGPRGCGKTTSARILARCLNCAQGPTDTPCGTCDSCVELGRGGGGSLDVVEIDAASHNGVDDARDLRERAIFAPARDRFKIFILDEAHMVTPQGFNALLKLVEEPPDHVKFIFATTEPEKVIGTIRSRTHHYPFRLVPPAAMLAYVEELCRTEGVEVEPGVLPLVVRAGGGSPRDTLSLLDQLIAGSDDAKVAYARAVSLLGYTHAELLDEVADAFATSDAAAAFAAVDRVIQTGQDPRRFVDDLLERLRDLIVIAATGEGASAVLRGLSADDIAHLSRQADAFGSARLSRTADIVISALDEMTGATSPRLQLELMVARVLAQGAAPASAPAPTGVSTAAPAAAAAPTAPTAAPAGPTAPTTPASPTAPTAAPAVPTTPEPRLAASVTPPSAVASAPEVSSDVVDPPAAAPAPVPTGPVTTGRLQDAWPEVLGRLEAISRTSWLLASNARVTNLADDVLTLTFSSAADVAKFKERRAGAGPSEDLRRAIQSVVGITVKYLARHEPDGGSRTDDEPPPPPDDEPPPPDDAPPAPPQPSSKPSVAPSSSRPAGSQRPPAPRSAPSAAAPVTEWAVAPIPTTPGAPSALPALAVDDEPEDAASALGHSRVATIAPAREGDVLPSESGTTDDDDDDGAPEPESPDAPVPPVVAPRIQTTLRTNGVQRVGEAVVRQMLGARYVGDEPFTPPTRFN